MAQTKTKPSIDLSRLSKAEKLALIDALERKRAIDRKKRPQFVPFDKQKQILASPALEKYLFCGNGFSKTALLVAWVHMAATGYDFVNKKTLPVPSTIYLVVDDPSKIEQKIIPEYRKWFDLSDEHIHKDGKPHPSRFTYDNGSVVHVITHEVNLLKLEGVEMTHLAFDEPPPRHVFLGLYRGGRVKGRPLQIFMAGTPLYQPWLRIDVYEKWVDGELPNVECFFGSSQDNPHNPPDYTERFGKLLTEEEKQTRFHGAFFDASGQALAHLWQPKLHMIEKKDLEWREENPCVVVMDPHPSKAHHAVLMGVDRDGYLYVLDEYKAKKLARQFTTDLIERNWFTDYRVQDIVYDSLGSGDSTSGEGFRSFGEVVNEVLRGAGIGRARATTYHEKDDEEFVERIRDTLSVPDKPDNFGRKLPKLRFLSHCRGAERDVKQCQWQRDKRTGENKPKLDISNRDFLSCIKYGLATNLHFKKGKDIIYSPNHSVYGFRTRPKIIG